MRRYASGVTNYNLRELKKDRTRAAITRFALELFARDGFHATTVNDIARAAEVAPRTVSTYFPSKEGLVFDVYEASIARFADRLARRSDGETVFDVLLAALVGEEQEDNSARGVVLDTGADQADLARLREVAIASDRDLWALQRLHTLPLAELISNGAAEDLGIERDSLMAQVIGEITVTVLLAVNARAAQSGTATSKEFESAHEFLRAALETVNPNASFGSPRLR
jgi:AcrR family transcriptional regulator